MSQESDGSFDEGEEFTTKVIYCFFVPRKRTTIWPCAFFKSFFKIGVLITFLQEQPSRRCKSSYVENLFSLEDDSLSAVALFPFGKCIHLYFCTGRYIWH